MNLLILHQNYPGQFGQIASALAVRDGWRVVGVGSGSRQPAQVAPARFYGYDKLIAPNEARFVPLEEFGEHIRRGRTAADVMKSLRRKGFRPDVVLAHPGWGEAMFARDVFPDARHVAYLEYFYRATESDVDFDPEFPAPASDLPYLRLRNLATLLAHAEADACVTPTRWQADRFPAPVRPGLTVIHEGVDTTAVAPNPDVRLALPDGTVISRDDEVVTFAARSLEPYRGFHVFMRALPALLRRRPRVRVLIVGGDSVSYGQRPRGGRSWREALGKELGDSVDLSRVTFLGRLQREQYVAVLQVSSVHVYLTYPFVLSWSPLEAMAAGCAVVASATGPVTEVIEDGKNGRLFDFFDRDAMVATIADLLDDPGERRRLGREARKTIVRSYNFERKTYPQYRKLLAPG